MKVKEGLLLTENAGDYYIVPTGEASRAFSGFIRLNQSGKEIYEALAEGLGPEEAAQRLLAQYEDLDADTARRAVGEVVNQLKAKGLIVE